MGDACYGRSHALRAWLEAQGRADALLIPKTNAVEYEGRRARAEQLGAHLPAGGADGPWACLALSAPCAAGMGRWLLVHRDAADPRADASFLAHGPAGTSAEELVRVCRTRCPIEEGFAQAKGEVGLDQDEVRRWDAWHRHVTRCLLAHASLVVMRQAARQEERAEKGAPPPA